MCKLIWRKNNGGVLSFLFEYLIFGLNYVEVLYVYLSNFFGGLCVLIIESLFWG